MKVSSLKAAAFFTVAAYAASVGIAHAVPLTADDTKCRATVAKNVVKLGSTISKAFDGCIKDRVKNLTGACATTATADLKSKVAGTKAKLAEAVGGAKTKCLLPDHALSLAEHQICGTPNGAAITDFSSVATCVNDITDKNIERWRNAIMSPNYALAAGDIGKCINAIAKNATKLFSTIQKEQSKAQNTSDKALGDSNYNNPGDPSGKIGTATTGLASGITSACSVLTPADWAVVRACDDDLTGVIDCVTDKTTAAGQGLVASAYDQPGSCPASVEVKIHHGGQGGADLGATELDVGWTGFGHDADVIDDFVGAVDISCGAAPDDCTTCSATASCSEGNCRCSNSITTLCTQPFGEDGIGVEECGAADCRLFFGPSLPLSAAGTPTCVVNEIVSELVNTANIATGESDTAIDNVAIVHLGINQAQPCPTCVASLCDGGARDGLACSIDGTSPFGDVSYDCPPDALDNISGAGLQISLDLTDDAVSMPFALACDSPLGAFACACSTCSLDNSVPCNSNAECSGLGLGVCRVDGLHGGVSRQPNGCNDLTCNDQGGEEGECNAGPNDLYCDGFLKGSGGGIITCASNTDCSAGTTGVVGGAGNCSLTEPRSCFLDPIDVDGTPGSEGAVLVSNFCSPPTASGAVNGAAGTPGPARLSLDFEFVGRCADGSIWGTGGANCQ
jgi:hypothetical protein